MRAWKVVLILHQVILCYSHLFYSSHLYSWIFSQICSRNEVLTPLKPYFFAELLELNKYSGCSTQSTYPSQEVIPPSPAGHHSSLHTHRHPSWSQQRFWTFSTTACAGSSITCNLSVPPSTQPPCFQQRGADPGKGSLWAARPNSLFTVSSAVCVASADRPQSQSVLCTSLLAAFKNILIKNWFLHQFSFVQILFTVFC